MVVKLPNSNIQHLATHKINKTRKGLSFALPLEAVSSPYKGLSFAATVSFFHRPHKKSSSSFDPAGKMTAVYRRASPRVGLAALALPSHVITPNTSS